MFSRLGGWGGGSGGLAHFKAAQGGSCSANSIASANKEMKVGATSDGLCCMQLSTILLCF